MEWLNFTFSSTHADPYELRNLIGSLPSHEEDWMLASLIRLKSCKGKVECGENGHEGQGQGHAHRESTSTQRTRSTIHDVSLQQPSIWEKIFGT